MENWENFDQIRIRSAHTAKAVSRVIYSGKGFRRLDLVSRAPLITLYISNLLLSHSVGTQWGVLLGQLNIFSWGKAAGSPPQPHCQFH